MKLVVLFFTIFFMKSGVNHPAELSDRSVSKLDWGTLRDYNLEEVVFENALADTLIIELGVLVGQMKFDKPILEVKHGRNVSIIFKNNGIMPHNLLILQQGSKDKVGQAADKMISQKSAKDKNYIPDLEEVLFYTPIVDPGKEFKLNFTVPNQKGEYPFLCTFPGHWRIMHGVLKVN